MSRSTTSGVCILLACGVAFAQPLYRPFEAPPGPRTSAEMPWPAPAAVLSAAVPGIGRAATPGQVAGWDITVRGDGHNLPPGRGTAREGDELYQQHCAACHGDFGEGLQRWPALIGGRGSLGTNQPRRTIGSYWQHAPVVFDYIRRAMPYAAPQSLTNDEYYAITAYVLHLNELVAEDEVMDASTLPRVVMPNRDGFVVEARPDTVNDACMANCRQGRPVSVTMDSRQFVQPGSGSGRDTPE